MAELAASSNCSDDNFCSGVVVKVEVEVEITRVCTLVDPNGSGRGSFCCMEGSTNGIGNFCSMVDKSALDSGSLKVATSYRKLYELIPVYMPSFFL